jgi:hypothetical protein
MTYAKKPDGALEVGDVFKCKKLGGYVFVVLSAKYGGGGVAMFNDEYPDGWQVRYEVIEEKALRTMAGVHTVSDNIGTFYMSGCFNNIISVDDIVIIGKMKPCFVWEKFPE